MKAESCSLVAVLLITEHLLFLAYFSNSGIWTLLKHLALILSQMQKYFLEMKSKMPSLSPVDKNWPARPYLFLDSTHKELKRIFHLWRVGYILVQSTQNFIMIFNSFVREGPGFGMYSFLFQPGWFYFFGRCMGFDHYLWPARGITILPTPFWGWGGRIAPCHQLLT